MESVHWHIACYDNTALLKLQIHSFKSIFYLFMCEHLCQFMCTRYSGRPKCIRSPRKWSQTVVSHIMWLLGTESRSSVRVAALQSLKLGSFNVTPDILHGISYASIIRTKKAHRPKDPVILMSKQPQCPTAMKVWAKCNISSSVIWSSLKRWTPTYATIQIKLEIMQSKQHSDTTGHVV